MSNLTAGAVLVSGLLVSTAIYFKPEPGQGARYAISALPNESYIRADTRTGAVDYCTNGIDPKCVEVDSGPNK